MTRTSELLYGSGFEGIDLDPTSGSVAFTVGGYPIPEAGVYMVSPDESLFRVPEVDTGGYAGPIEWVPQLGRYFTEGVEGITSFLPTGQDPRVFLGEYCLPEASPNGSLLAFWGCGAERGLRIYSAAGELLNEYELEFVESVAWSPEADLLYYLEDARDDVGELGSLPLSSGEIRTVDPDAHGLMALVTRQAVGQPTVRLLPTAIPELQPLPTPTEEPRPDSELPLNPTGPWLVSVTDDGVIVLNPDGTGRRVMFRGSGDLGSSAEAFFPRWDAYLAGSEWVAIRSSGTDEMPVDRQLLLAQLPGTEAVREIQLVSPELASELAAAGDEELRTGAYKDLRMAMGGDSRLTTTTWSPDGRQLAFVAAMDGPSADLYVYDTRSDEVRRLTSGPNQPHLLGWSPDSHWVLHEEIKDIIFADGLVYSVEAVCAAAADGSSVKRIPGLNGPLELLGWLSPTRFVVLRYVFPPEPQYRRMKVVDLHQGPVTDLYQGSMFLWALAPEFGEVAFFVNGWQFSDEDTLPLGLYLNSVDDGPPQSVDLAETVEHPTVYHLSWSAPLGAFVVKTKSDHAVAVSPEGEITPVSGPECEYLGPSPDGLWLGLGSCFDRYGLRLRRLADGHIIQPTTELAYGVTWLPDASGIYYFQGEDPARLMFLAIPDGSPEQIHPDPGLELPLYVVGWPEGN